MGVRLCRGALLLSAALCVLLTGCGGAPVPSSSEPLERMELRYAEQFTVDLDREGRALVTIGGEERYLIVPPEGTAPADPGEGVKVLQAPLTGIYLASSSAMDCFDGLDALDAVRFTGTTASNWTLPAVEEAMEEGRILYAGKYSAPDYELLLEEGCSLAVENTMIRHTPEIAEQLEALGIPVLIELSSYESHPLGRMEWLRFYGLLTGKGEEADALFLRQAEEAESIMARENTGRTAAFFYITANGSVNVRKSGDYAARLMELAGGRYVFSDLVPEDESALSTMNLQMETFYAGARDADILIYNATVDGGVETLAQLLEKCPLLSDFRAVQNGEVWCTEQNLFQNLTGAAGMIADFHAVFTGTAAEHLTYLRRLR